MFKYFEPNKIFSITSKAPKYVLLLFIIVLSVGLIEALILSPEDYKQSHSVRIMYVHVPAAWLSLQTYIFMAVTGFIALVWKVKIKVNLVKNKLTGSYDETPKVAREYKKNSICSIIIFIV